MAESFEDQLSRLEEMSVDHATTWDLSPNDQAAIKAVLANRNRQALRIEELDAALRSAPAWHPRPNVPGLWLCAFGGSMLSQWVLDQSDLDRGVPFGCTLAYGPIPDLGSVRF